MIGELLSVLFVSLLDDGIKVGVNDFIIKAAAVALQVHSMYIQ